MEIEIRTGGRKEISERGDGMKIILIVSIRAVHSNKIKTKTVKQRTSTLTNKMSQAKPAKCQRER